MQESVIDFPKDTLCPHIWEKVVDQNGMKEVWKIIPDVKTRIFNFIKQLLETAKLGNLPDSIHITGSITSNSYTENADIDIHFHGFHIRELSQHTQIRISNALKKLRETNKEVTYIGSHPLEVYYQTSPYQDLMSVGCYDFISDKWLVGPELTDPSFNPYSEYYKEIQELSESYAQRIRNMILSIYEIAIVYKKNAQTEMASSIRQILIQKLSEVQDLYDGLRDMRKAYSMPQSEEEALQFRNSRKWKVADASFKLFDKYGYMAILKQFIEDYKLMSASSDVDNEIVEDLLSAVKNYINNVDKLAEEELYEGMQDETVDTKDKFKIWVDDIREVPEGYIWIKSVDEFIKFVDEHGVESIEVFDFDHDAGNYNIDGGDYIRCLDYLEFIKAKDINVRLHTGNPVGRQNMQRIIKKNGWKEVRDLIEDEEQIDEDSKSAITTFALALALLIPGMVSAKTAQSAQQKLKAKTAEVKKKQNMFIALLNGKDPNKMMNGYKLWQACNILALTLYGEGRGEIRSGGLDPITDSILNRTAITLDIDRVANICVGKKEGRAFQYSFWNKNKTALQSITAGEPVVPATITNIIERKAWEECVTRAVEVVTKNYKVQDTNINSYYVKDMDSPPAWSDEMTNVKIVGSHKFGYVKTNDPDVMDMATMTPIKSKDTVKVATKDTTSYVVKKGDTLWKIAKQYNTTVKEITLKNKIDTNGTLEIGQKLKV